MRKQKRMLMLTLVTAMVLTSLQLPVFAFNAVMSDATQAPCLVKLAEDNFNAVDGTDLANYTGVGTENAAEGWGATGWGAGSKWMSYSLGVASNFTVGDFTITNNEAGRRVGNKNSFEWSRSLASSSYIDLSQNMDYYITYRVPKIASAGSASSQYLKLYSGTTSVLSVGLARNHSVNSFSVSSSLLGASSKVGVRANDPYTLLVYIGARSGAEKDIVKMKLFDESNINDTFTYSPQTWDSEQSAKLDTTSAVAVTDSIHLSFTNGTGNPYQPKFDNIRIEKSAPVIASVNATNYINFAPVIGQQSVVSVTPTNVLGNAQTVQSIEWFNYANGQPQLIQNGDTYAITNDVNQVGQLLRCKVTVKDDVTKAVSSYWPVTGYIRDVMDVVSYSFIGTSSNSSVSTTNGQLTETSTMKAYANIAKNGVTAAKPQLIIVLYDSVGNLKSVQVPSLLTLGGIGTVTQSSVIIYAAGSFVTGDSVKIFVWDSLQGVRPVKTNLNSPAGSYTFPGYPTF